MHVETTESWMEILYLQMHGVLFLWQLHMFSVLLVLHYWTMQVAPVLHLTCFLDIAYLWQWQWLRWTQFVCECSVFNVCLRRCQTFRAFPSSALWLLPNQPLYSVPMMCASYCKIKIKIIVGTVGSIFICFRFCGFCFIVVSDVPALH